jgi:hypothetical protein
MDGLQYFIGNRRPSPRPPERTLAVVGAHMTHMLRDLQDDLPHGMINVPVEDLETYGFTPEQVESEAGRAWVRRQVEHARACFRSGRRYIDSLDLLRLKLAGTWYCARFEYLLDLIERDDYRLRREYGKHHSLRTWLRMFGLGIAVTLKHVARRLGRIGARPVLEPDWPRGESLRR